MISYRWEGKNIVGWIKDSEREGFDAQWKFWCKPVFATSWSAVVNDTSSCLSIPSRTVKALSLMVLPRASFHENWSAVSLALTSLNFCYAPWKRQAQRCRSTDKTRARATNPRRKAINTNLLLIYFGQFMETDGMRACFHLGHCQLPQPGCITKRIKKFYVVCNSRRQ